ncbi:uncharacterized protein [Thunnus thynnus]|uniref:uncharacterized protein isoform X1 n=1 Tax=Thunnus thynnus TaxID=8237 RepID=UPI003527D03A
MWKMSRFQELKDLYKRRLINAARGDLFGHFERSISGIEKEIDHKRKLLGLVLNHDIKQQRAVHVVAHENAPPARRVAMADKASSTTAGKRTAGPQSDSTIPAKRFVAKKATNVEKSFQHLVDRDAGESLSVLLTRRTRELDAEKGRAEALKVEMTDLREEMTALREESQRQKEELEKQISELRAALDVQTTQQDVNSPEKPLSSPRLSSKPTSSASCSPSSFSIIPADSSHFHRLCRQHPDIKIREVKPEDHTTLLRMSQGRADRYGCLLFRFVTPEEKYRAWCVTTNWDGSRGKWELPGNLKEFLVNTMRQKFSPMSGRDEKMLINRINEVLRTPRQFALGLIH